MTLAEALMERKDLVKQINRIKEEILSLVKTPKFDVPDSNYILEQNAKYLELMQKLADINIIIDKGNIVNIGMLNNLRILDSTIAFYVSIREKLLNSKMGYSDTEYVKNIKLDLILSNLERFEKERRKIDKKLQAINWQTQI